VRGGAGVSAIFCAIPSVGMMVCFICVLGFQPFEYKREQL